MALAILNNWNLFINIHLTVEREKNHKKLKLNVVNEFRLYEIGSIVCQIVCVSVS